MASTWAPPFWMIIAVTRSGCMTANRKPTDAPMSERYSAYEERFSFSVNFSVTVANRSSSRMNADDRLSLASLGRVEGGDGIVEARDVADVGPQSSVSHPLHDLTQLGAIGLDDEIDGQTVGGPPSDWADDGHQRSPCPNQTRGPLLDVAADDVKDQVDRTDVFQRVVVEVDELHRPEVE